jgi:GNAT superfamily N-acetyltransferase
VSELVVTSAGVDRVAALEPLWAAMHAAHAAMADAVAPVRPVGESWRRRRAQYEEWLAAGDTRLLVAEHAGEPVGYAVVRAQHGAATWDIGERVAELESLSVVEARRGEGIGQRLMAAAREAADELGAHRLLVSVVHANEAALRFYTREGFSPFYVLLMESTARPSGGA